MKIANLKNNVNFKSILSSRYLYHTQNQIDLMHKMETELHQPYPKKNQKTYMQVYEKKGYNIYINQGNTTDTIDVFIANKDRKTGTPILDETTFVGTYKSCDEFNINDIDKVFQQHYKTMNDITRFHGYLGALLITAAAGFFGYQAYRESIHEPKKIISDIISHSTDSLKKDSLNISKDSLNLIKK